MKQRRLRKIRGFFIIILLSIMVYNIALTGTEYVKTLIYPLKYKAYIEKNAEIYDLDPMFVAAVINVESKFKEKAESGKGAMGLMQIIESTALWGSKEIGLDKFEKEDLYDPLTNIQIGCWYLSRLRMEFGEEKQLILAAYNGGSGNVSKWLNNSEYSIDGKNLIKIPFKETSEYVVKVLAQYEKYQEIYE